MINASDQIARSDLRRHRAMQLVGAVLTEFRAAGVDVTSDMHRVLLDVFYRNGACVESDQTRYDEGKEPRDELGWTASERVRYEQELHMLLVRQPQLVIHGLALNESEGET